MAITNKIIQLWEDAKTKLVAYFPKTVTTAVLDKDGKTVEARLGDKVDKTTYDTDKAGFALKTEIPDTSGLATKSDISDMETKTHASSTYQQKGDYALKSELANKANKVTVTEHGTSDTTFALTPNILHVWGEVTALNLTLAPEKAGEVNEYMFQFTSGATATTLSVPSTVKWIGGKAPKIASGKTYQGSIINNIGAIGEA